MNKVNTQRNEATFDQEHERHDNENDQSDKKIEIEVSRASNSDEDSPLEGTSVVRSKLPPGKVSWTRKSKKKTLLTIFKIKVSVKYDKKIT